MRKASPYIWQHIDYSISILKLIIISLILISIIKNEAISIYYIAYWHLFRIINDSILCSCIKNLQHIVTIYICIRVLKYSTYPPYDESKVIALLHT